MKKVKKWKNKGQGLLVARETFPLLAVLRMKWNYYWWGCGRGTVSGSGSGAGVISNNSNSNAIGIGMEGDMIGSSRRRKHFPIFILFCVSIIACGLYYATYFHVVSSSWQWRWRNHEHEQGHGHGQGHVDDEEEHVNGDVVTTTWASFNQPQTAESLRNALHSRHLPFISDSNVITMSQDEDERDESGMRMKGNESFMIQTNDYRYHDAMQGYAGESRGQQRNVETNYYSKHESNNGQAYNGKGEGDDEKLDLDERMACKLPRLNPMDKSIIEFVKEPSDIICTSNSHPMIFRTNFHSTLIQMPQYHQYNLECCYRTFQRGNFSDKEIKFSRECYPVSKTEQMIPVEHEFIYISCKNASLTPINHTNLSSTRKTKFKSADVNSDGNGIGNGNGNGKRKSKSKAKAKTKTKTKSSYHFIPTLNSKNEENLVELINFKDMFAFVPLKPHVESRIAQYYAFQREKEKRRQFEEKLEPDKERKNDKISMSTATSDSVTHTNTNTNIKRGKSNSVFSNNSITISKSSLKEHVNNENKNANKMEPGLSVLILGLDAQSHMNFLRQMPLTRKYLAEDLNAIALQGYTKVSDNTFPNIIPLLTGLNVSQLQQVCWFNKNSYFDECPFIWKEFGKRGYRTSFAEDSVWMGAFNYNKAGFLKQPTDYYLHPMAHFMAKKIGHELSGNSQLCYGSRLSFEVLLEYIVKTAVTFGQTKRYFQFVWATSLFHDFLNNPRLGDEILLMTIQFLHRNGYLNQTLFLLLSDHGIRWGGIRKTYQGKIEERMPLAYFTFPPWFHREYPELIANLKLNSRRLTTPFDIHQVLKDILYFPRTKFKTKSTTNTKSNLNNINNNNTYKYSHSNINSDLEFNKVDQTSKNNDNSGLKIKSVDQASKTNDNSGIKTNSGDRTNENDDEHQSLVSKTSKTNDNSDLNHKLNKVNVILNVNNDNTDHIQVNNRRIDRGLTLFQPIPLTRTCEDAEISEHWCVCNAMEVISSKSPIVRSGAIFIVEQINRMLQTMEDYCAKLELSQITEAMKIIEEKFETDEESLNKISESSTHIIVTNTTKSNLNLESAYNMKTNYSHRSLNTNKRTNGNNNNATVDHNANEAKERANKEFESGKIQLQITLVTQPGGGIFEATLSGVEVKKVKVKDNRKTKGRDMHSKASRFSRNTGSNRADNSSTNSRWHWKLSGDISRISHYGSQSACISNFILQKYCYCITSEELHGE